MVGGFDFYKFEALAFLADDELVLDSNRLDGRLLRGESRLAKLFAEFERGAVECGYLVVGLDEQVGDAERVERGQQMLDGADRAAAAGQRGVVAGVGDVVEADRDGGLVGQRGEHDSESGGRGMQYDAGLESGVKPLPAHHDRARDGALRDRAGADCFAAGGADFGAHAARAGRIRAGGVAFESARDRREQAADRERLLDKIGGAELGGSDGTLDVGVARDHDHRHPRLLGFDPAQQLDAVHLGHPDVEQHDRGTLARDKVYHARPVAGVNDMKAFVA